MNHFRACTCGVMEVCELACMMHLSVGSVILRFLEMCVKKQRTGSKMKERCIILEVILLKDLREDFVLCEGATNAPRSQQYGGTFIIEKPPPTSACLQYGGR
jgi:hypothetical protein